MKLATKRAKKPRHALRVVKGGYAPADASTASVLRQGHRVGDLVFAEFSKPRSPGFHKLSHQLGSLLAENLERFEGMKAHAVLKALQIETGLGCDETLILSECGARYMHRIPRSLSYESMSDDEFRPLIQGFCQHVARRYWKTCTPQQIEAMASAWVEAT